MTETRKGYETFQSYKTWGAHCTRQNTTCYRMERAANFTDTSNRFVTQRDYMNVSNIRQVALFNDSCSDDSDEAESKGRNAPIRALSMRNFKPSLQNKNKGAARLSLNRDAGIKASNPMSQYVNFQDFLGSLSESNIKPSKPESPKGAQLAFPKITKRKKCRDRDSGLKPTEENKSSE